MHLHKRETSSWHIIQNNYSLRHNFNLTSFIYLFIVLFFEWPLVLRFSACYEVICSTIPDSWVQHGNFWHLECSLLDCISYISSSIVIEIPVSSAWCVNVIQISFYSKKHKTKKRKKEKKKLLPECYLCIKHFGSYIWLFISVLLLLSLN